MKRIRSRRHNRGVTLIEALVAMAVMAFGMLALVGVQSTLRLNADLAKQRAEATRLAEQQLEVVRGFLTVGSGNAASTTEFDNLASTPEETIALPTGNTIYHRQLTIVTPPDSLERAVKVTVSWTDRYGVARDVVVRDLVSRAAPELSGLATIVRKVTVVGQRKNRHPTIPIRAGDLGDGRSVFKPREGGTVAWVFNNTTGVITSVCTVVTTTQSSTLTSSDLASCTSTNAQLLAGVVSFNLRGVSNNLGSISVFKPVPGDTVAWVIDNSLARIVRSCSVSASSTTATLVAADVPVGCNAVNPTVSQNIATFDASDVASYVLTANDSEFAMWPALNLDVHLTLTSGNSPAPLCLANGPSTSISANSQKFVEYFCIIYPNSSQNWAGRLDIIPSPYSDGNGAVWSLGTTSGSYRVCRYTTASTDYTENIDHPATYSKWLDVCGTPGQPACHPVTGNLTNQNFLIIDGTKTCPTDTAVNPAAGDLVNSNTLQHQP